MKAHIRDDEEEEGEEYSSSWVGGELQTGLCTPAEAMVRRLVCFGEAFIAEAIFGPSKDHVRKICDPFLIARRSLQPPCSHLFWFGLSPTSFINPVSMPCQHAALVWLFYFGPSFSPFAPTADLCLDLPSVQHLFIT